MFSLIETAVRISAWIWSFQKIADIVHESTVIPESIKKSTPIGIKGQALPDHYEIDSSKAQKDLGVTYIPLKKTVEDLVLQLAELQAMLKQWWSIYILYHWKID